MLPVSALWTMTTAVVEATVVASAAVSGAKEAFEAGWAFAAGKATGFAFLALTVAVIAGNGVEVLNEPSQRGSLGLAWLRALPPLLAGPWRKPPLGGILNRHEPMDSLVRRRIDAFPGQRNLKYPHSSLE